jgi:hypothetical protein
MTPSELAVRERVQRPTVTRFVCRLEELGLVTRAADPTDRRSALITITPQGSGTAVPLWNTDLHSADVAATSTAVEEAPPVVQQPVAAPRAARTPTITAERPRGRGRRAIRATLVLVVVLAVVTGAVIGADAARRNVYFLGQERGLVTLYRGVPYELPLGIDLYESRYVSSVPVRGLRPIQRQRLLDHQLRSRDDAADLVRSLEKGSD